MRIEILIVMELSPDILYSIVCPVMQYPLCTCIQMEIIGIGRASSQYTNHIRPWERSKRTLLCPNIKVLLNIGDRGGTIDIECRAILYTDIAAILKEGNQVLDKGPGIFRGVDLTEQDIIIVSIPSACPVLVCPAEAKRHSDIRGVQKHFDRFLQDQFSREPVVVKDLTVYSGFLHHL